ncbi:peptidase M14 [Paenibacillus sp. IB182496]|uniref:Peptidase M14 n=1 Tax=Paenibacillus sabuli TaxID=2772509 RepID=A0A927BSL1_9BACL|nr:M14 family metallocarboxypeptidase [Paenibacillus sabuli]MBD2846013.1 peptidase M14 [Paenibacillus sabuli]
MSSEDTHNKQAPRERIAIGPEALDDRILTLQRRSAGIVTRETIGTSVCGRSIAALCIGRGRRQLHVNAAFHANEWITSLLLMRFLETLTWALQDKETLRGVDVAKLCEAVRLWAVPMVNPDGVALVVDGLPQQAEHAAHVLRCNGGSRRFEDWKANIRGVDLNDQFPAHWEAECARREREGPGPRDYPGPHPLSEPEAAALARLTERERFELVVALHTQGEEIYWNYRGYEPPEAEGLARRLAAASGYEAVRLTDSDAGYKDWFIQRFGRPGFTVEAGLGVNPLPLADFDVIYDKVEALLLEAMSATAQQT